MRFDLQWLINHLDNAPEPDELADRLTACGLLIETREPAGSSEIWDIEVTTNRPDAMNHRGLAREAAAATDGNLTSFNIDLTEDGESAASLASIEIEAPDLCSRYVGRVIRNVHIVESPDWLKQRLENCGVRPINAVVDATNYVLLELGQPLHAFDLDLLEGRKIVVRRAAEGEALSTLDGEMRKLDPEMLVIADGARPIALAGVMGGANSEINDGTTTILLESAHFDALSVRRTARRLGMHTEASHRFERGCDPEMAALAADAAASLIANLTGGTTCRGVIDVYPRRHEGKTLSFSASRLSAFTGLEIPVDTAVTILDALEFQPCANGDEIRCTVPSFRIDIELIADLYEEVIRHVGYDRIPAVLPTLPSTPGHRSANWELVDRGRDACASAGLAEVVTYSFIDDGADTLVSVSPLCPSDRIELDNPLASTQAIMRRSLMPGLLSAARESLSKGEPDLAIFEQGRIFSITDDTIHEKERLGVVLSGLGIGHSHEVDFSRLKGVAEAVLARIGFPPVTWQRAGTRGLVDPSEGAFIIVGGDVVGEIGLLRSEIAGHWDLRQPAYVAEIDLDAALPEVPLPHFTPLPRYPKVTTDMTMEHKRDLEFAAIAAKIDDLAGDLAEGTELVSRYEGENLAAGAVRTTLRVIYRHRERSLTQDEVNAAHEELRRQIETTLPVSLI